MRFKLTLLLLFGLIIVTSAWGQNDSLSDNRISGIKVGYTYSGLNNIEVGFGKGKLIPVREMIGPAGYYGGFVHLGYAFSEGKSLLSTKLSYEFMTVLPGARVSLINLTDFKGNQLVFLPEIGLTYNALITAMYGYNIFLTDNGFGMNRHSFGISIIPYWKKRTKKGRTL